ncbi:UNVERIFIED_CONTAM: hypothetical protein PYX00_011429 [Menopon gallinae]|uniref:ditrans,polycis-polyprenyl diphosphate synthase [(2E,6E)-farnesyldiphosphate specific] n=1 Tax=Menopon gallinae TaxID=328185 RepID=A0AAW2H7H7_9NEOP
MKCHNCSESRLVADPIRGLVYCSQCGVVQEDDSIVSSLDFSEEKGVSRLTGQIIQITETFTKVGKTFIQTTPFYIENKIQNICSGLGLGNDHACSAFRWYKLALQYNVSKGKNILYTLSACIYIVCRQEKTPHMMIDFSSLLRIDVHKIGRVFLKILHFLGIKTALIDPSLYLPRFVTKLGIRNAKVLEMSMRLVGRMKRDWIVVGRRPNNLCGAALLVACRIFGEERDIEDIARVANVSVITINKRLRELCDTRSAGLSVRDFISVWLEGEEEPPIIKKRRLAGEIDRMFGAGESSDATCCDEQNSTDKEDVSVAPCRADAKENIAAPVHAAKEAPRAAHRLQMVGSTESDEGMHIDDREIDELILSKDETEKRERIWNEMYGEYMRWKESKVFVEKRQRRRKQTKKFNNFVDAVKNCIQEKKLTKKINFEAIKKLFEGPPGGLAAESLFHRSAGRYSKGADGAHDVRGSVHAQGRHGSDAGQAIRRYLAKEYLGMDGGRARAEPVAARGVLDEGGGRPGTRRGGRAHRHVVPRGGLGSIDIDVPYRSRESARRGIATGAGPGGAPRGAGDAIDFERSARENIESANSSRASYLEAKIRESQGREGRIAEELSRVDEQMEALARNLGETRARAQETQIELLNRRNSVKNMVARREASEKAVRRLGAEMRILNNEVVRLSKELDEKKIRLENLNEDMNMQSNRVRSIEDELVSRNNEVEQDEARKSDLSKDVIRIEGAIAKLKEDRDGLAQEKSRENRVQARLQREIDKIGEAGLVSTRAVAGACMKAAIDAIDMMLNSRVLTRVFLYLPIFYIRAEGLRPAFIMDGNRRFSRKRGMKNAKRAGFDKFIELVGHCRGMGMREASFFVLSKKNLGRSRSEIEDIRELLPDLETRRAQMQDVRYRVIGSLELLEVDVAEKLRRVVEETRENDGITVNMFVAYSSDNEFDGSVDALVRTGRTKRLSDFLLVQVSRGAHITFLDCFWPEITYFHIVLVYWKFLLERRLLAGR